MFHSCPKLRDLSQKKSALQDVHNLVQTSKEFPEIKFTFADEKFASYVKEGENKRYHEAGYDALITGHIFLKSFPLMTTQEQAYT